MGCAPTSAARHPSDDASTQTIRDQIVRVEWRYETRNGRPVERARDHTILLLYGDDKLAVVGGCNTIFGSYGLEGNVAYPRNITATTMECGGTVHSHTPMGPLVTHRLYVEGNQLTIKYDDSVETYLADYTLPVRNTAMLGKWRLEGLAVAEPAMELWLQFAANRLVTIEARCSDGDSVTRVAVFGIAPTRELQLRKLSDQPRSCADTLLSQLDRRPLSYSVVGNSLVINGPRIELRLRRENSSR
jgi:hypothetical protein